MEIDEGPYPWHIQETWECAFKLSCTTNNEAEYEGLIHAIDFAIGRQVSSLTVHMDSQLVVQQVHGFYSMRSSSLLPYMTRVNLLAREVETFRLEWIERKSNKHADRLCREIRKSPHGAFRRLWTPPLKPRPRPPGIATPKREKNPFLASPGDSDAVLP